MPQKPESIAAKARKLCREFPDTPSRTLAKKLYAANVEHIASLNSARMAICAARSRPGFCTPARQGGLETGMPAKYQRAVDAATN
jgi:hypothetical protein